ncbi:MAG TPA: cysteine desulfurase family protein [Syntrophales bacterium]|nr:cysteine desulfurase family protein [Syntrophales bacterium]
MGNPVYLDCNATTPVDPEVAKTMIPFLGEEFGNPSSAYGYGIRAKRAVEDARARVAALLRCKPGEVVFTSGGTESNNHAIRGVAWANRHRGNHIITSAIEHPAVLEVCRHLEQFGFVTTYLPVDGRGLVDPEDVAAAVTERTILITVMHANNEVGTIEPLAEISNIARRLGILFHTDAAQSAGKIETDVDALGVDLLSLAGHKIYAPKGVGALYVREGTAVEKFMHGAGQERGFRPGTENVLGIVGLGKACEIARRDLEKNRETMIRSRERLFSTLSAALGATVRLNGHKERRLPNTASLGFRNRDAQVLLAGLFDKVAVSAGAACHSGETTVSPVLEAMKVPPEFARGTLRFSTGRFTTEEEAERAANHVLSVLREPC